MPDNSTTPWLAGLRLDDFSGSVSQQVAQAAHSIRADVLSPSASSFETPVPDPAMDGYVTFTTREMIDAAHERGMKVKPWTVSLLSPFCSRSRGTMGATDATALGEQDDYRRAAPGLEGRRHHLGL